MKIKTTIFAIILLVIGFFTGLYYQILNNQYKIEEKISKEISMLEKDVIIQEIYEKLDLTSFRNSTGPQREYKQKYFSDLGLNITSKTSNSFTIEANDWFYKITVKNQKDVNKDGIKDILVCFEDKSKNASYNTKSSLLLTRYYLDEDIIALNFEVFICDDL
jgi:hypothetical protein